MANWDSIINNRVMMGRSRSLCLALNATQRRREAGEEEWRPGVNPFLGRGIFPMVPRFNHWERVPGQNNNIKMARGRSRSFPAHPPNIIRQQPCSQPHCSTVGFGYVAPNACFPSRINPPSCPIFNPPCPCQNCCPCHLPPPPPPPQNDTESTSSESSDSEDCDSLEANHGSP